MASPWRVLLSDGMPSPILRKLRGACQSADRQPPELNSRKHTQRRHVASRSAIENGRIYRVRKTCHAVADSRRSRDLEPIALARHLRLTTRKEDTAMLYYALVFLLAG